MSTEATWQTKDLQSFKSAKRVIIRAMRMEHLVINEKGEPRYTPQLGNTDTITFHEPTGATYLAMDQKKKGHDIGKMFASMGDQTHTSAGRFSSMNARDLKVCQALIVLFLA